MFRISSVHHQERFVQAVFADFGMWLDVSSSTHSSTTHQSLRIQLVQNAPDDGPVRSETCRVEQYAYYHIPKSANTACTQRS